MPLETLIELVDLNIYPTAVHKLQPGEQLTIGDLHGNAVKLIYFLIKQGFLQFKKGSRDYQTIIDIYNQEPLTQESLAEFKNILDQATVTENASQALIRLIGDEVADRGNNDYFTLLVLKKLKENKIPTDIILSNHGAEFVRYYEDPKCEPQIDYRQISSLSGLKDLIIKNLVDATEVAELVNTVYKPSIKLLSYFVDSTTAPHTITLYSHAPIDRNMISNLVTYFNQNLSSTDQCTYNDLTVEGLTNAIDFINKEFEKLVIANQVSNHLTAGQPISNTIWNRNVVTIDRAATAANNAYGIRYVHGHVGETTDNAHTTHIVNLDTNLGRPESQGGNKGKYLVEVAKAPPKPAYAELETRVHIPENITKSLDDKDTFPKQLQHLDLVKVQGLAEVLPPTDPDPPTVTADQQIIQQVNWDTVLENHDKFAFTKISSEEESFNSDYIGSITNKDTPEDILVNIIGSGKLQCPLNENQQLKTNQLEALITILQALLTASAASFTAPLIVKANNFTEEHLGAILDILKIQQKPVYFTAGEEASENIQQLINKYNGVQFPTTTPKQDPPVVRHITRS